jgi:hypothetical protein
MRKIINSTYITLDGVIEGPHLWPSLGARPVGRRVARARRRAVTSPRPRLAVSDDVVA